MISNQILQSTIDGLKTITRVDLSVMDIEHGRLITSLLVTLTISSI